MISVFSATKSPGTQCPNLSDIHNFEKISNYVYQINWRRRNSSPKIVRVDLGKSDVGSS